MIMGESILNETENLYKRVSACTKFPDLHSRQSIPNNASLVPRSTYLVQVAHVLCPFLPNRAVKPCCECSAAGDVPRTHTPSVSIFMVINYERGMNL